MRSCRVCRIEHPSCVIARPPKPATPPQLIVASNRLPAAPTGDRKQEVGGLVSAILPALAKTQGVWLGWSGAERAPGLKLRVEPNDSYARARFDYPLTWRQRYYAGFCNRCLWPLLHGFTRVHYADDEWACYNDANRAFAIDAQLPEDARSMGDAREPLRRLCSHVIAGASQC